jgi:DNA-binding CsgD family transcriptional regulator
MYRRCHSAVLDMGASGGHFSTMSKPPTDQSMQSERRACKSRNPGEPDAEALRTLEQENQRLREQVASLTELVRRQGPQPSAGRNGDLPERDSADDLRPFPGHELLTERERAVLAHIIRGASSKQAGCILSISARTVEFHRANIMLKLGARNIAELVRIVLGEQT